MDLVSIITPSYNSSATIKKTIESVLGQTYKNFELIIVDDFSSDNTINIIKEYNDKRIKLFINDKNCGTAYSRNKGLKFAKGDYIAFLDSDDIWDCQKLEKQLNFMKNNNYEFSYTNYKVIDSNGMVGKKVITGPKVVTFRKIKQSNYIGCLTAMYKKEVYPELSIPNEIIKRNDYALWLLLLQRTNCYLLDECLAYYRSNNGLSRGRKSRLFKYHLNLFERILGYNSFHAFLRAAINVPFYFFRKIRFKKYE